MTLEQIKRELSDRNMSAVARATGMNLSTLYRLVHGKCRPHNATLRVLTAYLTTKG